MNRQLNAEIISEIENLEDEDQERVLAYAKSLKNPKNKGGNSGSMLRKYVGAISAYDLSQMSKAIEQDCERIDHEGW